jgi:hypothetical protein
MQLNRDNPLTLHQFHCASVATASPGALTPISKRAPIPVILLSNAGLAPRF